MSTKEMVARVRKEGFGLKIWLESEDSHNRKKWRERIRAKNC